MTDRDVTGRARALLEGITPGQWAIYVIERFLDLRTLPGEKVLTPFMGVGSEVYATVQMGRFAIGAELKPSYFTQALRNLAEVDNDRQADKSSIFDVIESQS